ncbi:MAG: SAM-dependent methyltransferase [Methanobacteriota archaeon]
MGVDAVLAAELSHGPVPFSRFMEICLYDPEHGFYSRPGRIGARGAYSTAAANPAFARAVATAADSVHGALGRPSPFSLVEVGPGEGALAEGLARSIAAEFPSLESALDLVLVERQPRVAAAQADRLGALRVRARWARAVGEVRAPAGVVVANEVLDALPVHRVRTRDGRLEEAFVVAGPRGLSLVWGAPTPGVREFLEAHAGGLPPEGHESEASVALAAFFAEVAAAFERGVLLFFDYGHEAAALRHPARREGALMGYRDHKVVADLLAAPGETDLTAHVNWTAVRSVASAVGLREVCFATQGRFLVAQGLLRGVAPPATAAELSAHLSRKTLAASPGLAEGFQALVLSKGIEPEPVRRALGL